MYHSLDPPENCSGLIILTKPLEISAAWMNRKDKHLSNCSGCALTTYTWVNQCHFNAYFDWNTGDILKCYAEFEMFYLIQQNVILATDLWLSLVQAWNRERENLLETLLENQLCLWDICKEQALFCISIYNEIFYLTYYSNEISGCYIRVFRHEPYSVRSANYNID